MEKKKIIELLKEILEVLNQPKLNNKSNSSKYPYIISANPSIDIFL